MIEQCKNCGGLYASGQIEMIAGTPCQCRLGAVPCSVSDTPRTNAVLSKPDDHPHLPTMFVELTIHAKQLERELAQWKQNFIPFAIVHAGQYGKEHYGKEGCLHYTHYDLLKEAGARLVDFTRCGDSQNKELSR